MGQDYATIREATQVSVCMCERERDRGVNFCKKKKIQEFGIYCLSNLFTRIK